jgi:hypothetical protein
LVEKRQRQKRKDGIHKYGGKNVEINCEPLAKTQ